MDAYLIAIGVYLFVRGVLYPPKNKKPKVVEPLGLLGGFLDAPGHTARQSLIPELAGRARMRIERATYSPEECVEGAFGELPV